MFRLASKGWLCCAAWKDTLWSESVEGTRYCGTAESYTARTSKPDTERIRTDRTYGNWLAPNFRTGDASAETRAGIKPGHRTINPPIMAEGVLLGTKFGCRRHVPKQVQILPHTGGRQSTTGASAVLRLGCAASGRTGKAADDPEHRPCEVRCGVDRTANNRHRVKADCGVQAGVRKDGLPLVQIQPAHPESQIAVGRL